MNIFKELFNSIIRTVVPAIVGFIMAWVTTTKLPVDPEFEGLLTGCLTVLFHSLYYITARFLETRFSDKWGWMIGLAKSPEYAKPAVGKHEGDIKLFSNDAAG